MPRGKKKIQAEIETELQKRNRKATELIKEIPVPEYTKLDVDLLPDDLYEHNKAAIDEKLCNHINQHSANKPACTLLKGHGGDHVGYVGDKITAWSDAAGTPVRKHA
jgi:hypothetical protein